MARSRRLVAAGALLAVASAATAQDSTQVFRAGIAVVSLNVTVANSQNRFVTGLEQSDFSVFEDGAAQDLLYFSKTSLPIALSLLIDTSASMEERLTVAQDAAVGFAQRVRSQDMAQVIDFDSRVEILQNFTNDKAALERAIRSTSSGGSTSLYNAVYIALRELETFDAVQAKLVELRYFGGLTIEETAEVMNISPATVKREWTIARAWLFDRVN